MSNLNEFAIGEYKFIWKHNFDGKGTLALVEVTYGHDALGGAREGVLKLSGGEWVFSRGFFNPAIETGTSNIHEAKKIVQVRLTMIFSRRKRYPTGGGY